MVPFLVPLSRSVLQVTSLNDSSTFLQSLKMLSKEAASGKHKASSPRGVQNLNTEGETQIHVQNLHVLKSTPQTKCLSWAPIWVVRKNTNVKLIKVQVVVGLPLEIQVKRRVKNLEGDSGHLIYWTNFTYEAPLDLHITNFILPFNFAAFLSKLLHISAVNYKHIGIKHFWHAGLEFYGQRPLEDTLLH